MSDIKEVVKGAIQAIGEVENLETLDQLRVQYLGKKGELTALLKQLGQLPAEERREAGQTINTAKVEVSDAIQSRKETLETAILNQKLASETVDVTLPGRGQETGGLHPVTRTLDRIKSLLIQVGFDIVEGPEIEDDFHNFEALNIPADHPARAMHDTFYINEHTVLRTHTSPVADPHDGKSKATV